MGRPMRGKLTWPPWVCVANDRAIRAGTCGNRSGLWVARRAGASSASFATVPRMSGAPFPIVTDPGQPEGAARALDP